jgi:DNA-binding MarR family transcriptional regulator
MSDIYGRLAKHLNNLPAVYPATESGVELRILKRLFTPQESEIAMGRIMMPEPASAIAEKLGMDQSELAPMLETMSKKGLIYRSTKDDQKRYMAA